MERPLLAALVLGAAAGGAAAVQVPHIFEALQKIPAPRFLQTDPGACTCLNWKETYRQKLAECGQGYEFASLRSAQALPASPEEFLRNASWHSALKQKAPQVGFDYCARFFERMDSNHCMRMHPHRRLAHSWCYVGDACTVGVKGGYRVSLPFKNRTVKVPDSAVRVKLCDASVDRLLSDMAPEELMNFSQRMGFWSPATVVRLSYPFERRFVYQRRANHTTEIGKIHKAGRPVGIDEGDGRGAKIIVHGSKVWRVSNRPLSFGSLACVSGCR